MIRSKIFSVFILLVGLSFFSKTVLAFITEEQKIQNLQQIQALLQQVHELSQKTLQASLPSISTQQLAMIPKDKISGFTYTWNRDLYYGLVNDPDVSALQIVLWLEGVYRGPITGKFANLTRQGVIAFQRKYNFSPIPSSGYVGPYTRKVLNELYGGGKAPESINFLKVSLDPSSPTASQHIAGSSDVPVAVIQVEAGPVGKEIILKQLGLILNGTISIPRELYTYTVWLGNTRVGSGYFDTTRKSITFFKDDSVIIPPNDKVILTLKLNIPIDTAGGIATINYDGSNASATYGMIKGTSNIVSSITKQNTNAAYVKIISYRSYR